MTGKDIRMNRFFTNGENAVVIAIDHGYMDGPIPGMINLRETVKKIDSDVDAILLAPGMLKTLGSAFAYKGAPMAVVRLNWSTVFCFEWGYNESRNVLAFTVKDAVEMGADMVLVSLTLQTGSEAQDARNVELFAQLCNEARRYGIPVIGESFPNDSDNLSAEAMHENTLRGTRILAELGADLIKTFYTHKFHDVVAGCPLPILGLGGRKTPHVIDSLRLAQEEIEAGARGVVFGRNAIQQPDPIAYQKALCAVVKHGVTPEEAMRRFNLAD
ncbi:MAG: hypothetical protein GX900_06960 [Clostridiaceae bacterium]|nr:hypothetical protein [Clostridiaceae bacterium]